MHCERVMAGGMSRRRTYRLKSVVSSPNDKRGTHHLSTYVRMYHIYACYLFKSPSALTSTANVLDTTDPSPLRPHCIWLRLGFKHHVWWTEYSESASWGKYWLKNSQNDRRFDRISGRYLNCVIKTEELVIKQTGTSTTVHCSANIKSRVRQQAA